MLLAKVLTLYLMLSIATGYTNLNPFCDATYTGEKKSLTISNKATAMIMAILYFAKINKWEDIEEIPF